MSHVSVAKTVRGKPLITDLAAVPMAAARLGMLCREDSEYEFWGRSLAGSPVPDGYTRQELGHNAVLVLSIPPEKWAEAQAQAGCGKAYGPKDGRPYELGVVPDRKNPGCYTLMYDHFMGGYGLERYIGATVQGEYGKAEVETMAPRFMMHYRMCADALTAQELGDSIEFEAQPDGSYVSFTAVDEERLREAIQ